MSGMSRYHYPFTSLILFFLDHLMGPLALVLLIAAAYFSFEQFLEGIVATIYGVPDWPERLLFSGLIGSGYFMVWKPPNFMMQVCGQDGFFINQSVRWLYYLCGKWFVSFSLPVLIAGYLIRRELGLTKDVIIALALIICVKHWYDAESLRSQVEDLGRQLESHYFDYKHTPSVPYRRPRRPRRTKAVES
jgi:hypothetical protein